MIYCIVLLALQPRQALAELSIASSLACQSASWPQFVTHRSLLHDCRDASIPTARLCHQLLPALRHACPTATLAQRHRSRNRGLRPERGGRRRERPHRLSISACRGRSAGGAAARRRARRAEPARNTHPGRGAGVGGGGRAARDAAFTTGGRRAALQRRRAGPRDRGRRRRSGRPHVRLSLLRRALHGRGADVRGRRAAHGRDRAPRGSRRRADRELRPALRRRRPRRARASRATEARLVGGALADLRAPRRRRRRRARAASCTVRCGVLAPST